MVDKLRLLVTNAFGLCSKFGEFQHQVHQHSPDIAIVTETKFTSDKFPLAASTFPGYHPPLRLDRTACGGGVAVWTKSNLAVKQLDQINCYHHEVIWLRVTLITGQKVVICAVYRSGSASDSDTSLLQYLDSTIDQARSYGSYLILAGDFNVHSKNWLNSSRTTPAGDLAEDVCVAHGLVQHVHSPTRGSNILDLVMSNFHDNVKTKVGPPIGASDHATVIIDFPLFPHREPKTRRVVWRYQHADWPRLRHYFKTSDWDNAITSSPDVACSQVTDLIHSGMSKFIPSKVLVTRATDPPWWTPECTASVQAKRKSWKVHRSAPSAQSRLAYDLAASKSLSCLRRAKASYISSLRTQMSSGSLTDKQWWSTVKKAGGESRSSGLPTLTDETGRDYPTNSAKAECLADFFASKCSLGNDDFKGDDIPPVQPRGVRQLTKVRFRPASVRKILKHLDASKASGPDGVSAVVLKNCAAVLAWSTLQVIFVLLFSRCSTVPMEGSTCGTSP